MLSVSTERVVQLHSAKFVLFSESFLFEFRLSKINNFKIVLKRLFCRFLLKGGLLDYSDVQFLDAVIVLLKSEFVCVNGLDFIHIDYNRVGLRLSARAFIYQLSN